MATGVVHATELMLLVAGLFVNELYSVEECLG